MARVQRLRPDGVDVARPDRLSPGHPRHDEIVSAHGEAVADRRSVYVDPVSGLSVMTARFLAERGYCCGSGCRHCPYEEY